MNSAAGAEDGEGKALPGGAGIILSGILLQVFMWMPFQVVISANIFWSYTYSHSGVGLMFGSFSWYNYGQFQGWPYYELFIVFVASLLVLALGVTTSVVRRSDNGDARNEIRVLGYALVATGLLIFAAATIAYVHLIAVAGRHGDVVSYISFYPSLGALLEVIMGPAVALQGQNMRRV